MTLLENMEDEGEGDTYYNWCARNNPQRLGKETGRHGNRSRSRDQPNYSIVEVAQNIEKSPGDLRRLAISQTLLKNQLMLV